MGGETLSMILSDRMTADDKFMKRIANQFCCACVGIVDSVNFEEQTVDVQPAVNRAILNKDLTVRNINMPLIPDVPFQCYKGGGYSITVPVQKGDEVLLVFTDTDYSAWFQSGGLQDVQSTFKHALSNAIAIVGISSLPNAIKNYNSTAVEIRNADGSEKISLSQGNITLKADTITIDGTTTIQGKDFLTHTHSNGNQGKPTGGVQ